MDNNDIDNNIIETWYCIWQLCHIVTSILTIFIMKILTLTLMTLVWVRLPIKHCLNVIDIDYNENIIIVNLAYTESKQQHLLNSNTSAAILFKDSKGGSSSKFWLSCSQYFFDSMPKKDFHVRLMWFFVLIKKNS